MPLTDTPGTPSHKLDGTIWPSVCEEARMDDPREFGQQLADKTVARMESEGLSSDEAAIFAAEQIVERADEWLLRREPRGSCHLDAVCHTGVWRAP